MVSLLKIAGGSLKKQGAATDEGDGGEAKDSETK